MPVPFQVSFRNVTPTPAIAAAIHERAAKLEPYRDRIVGCHVVVEAPHRRHHRGTMYHVGIDVTVPGKKLAVSREHAANHAHEDIYVAIRDAFEAVRRQLEGHMQRLRGETKLHGQA